MADVFVSTSMRMCVCVCMCRLVCRCVCGCVGVCVPSTGGGKDEGVCLYLYRVMGARVSISPAQAHDWPVCHVSLDWEQ